MSDSNQDGREHGGPTAVTIYGRTYQLRGGGEADYLRQLAARVDAKMRDVAAATGTADTLKVAILAALNLADEGERGKSDTGSRTSEVERDRIRTMIERIDEALAG